MGCYTTHHICNNLDWFLKHDKINPIMVNLPNGNSISTSVGGDVKISKDFVIQGVLYLPQFEVNLISVSKLCREQNCSLVFEINRCTIQERKVLYPKIFPPTSQDI